MKSLNDKFISKLKFPPEIITYFERLGEYKGKEDLFRKQSPDILEKLLESAVVQSTESSCRIEKIVAPHHRIEKIVKSNSKPKNRSEQEIAGYKDVLNIIHQSHKDIPINENIILQFHSMLYRYSTKKSGSWKTGENLLIDIYPNGSKKLRLKTVSAFETPRFIAEITTLMNKILNEDKYPDILLIALFILDFLCIHPFSDGNGRISRLLTLLLLYKAGFKIGKYISLERIVEESKDQYYDTLLLSSQKWDKGKHDVFPWLNYFLGILISAYKEFEERVGVFEGKSTKTEQ
ncbi:Fic family protein, partial [Candidatus Dependentiae bacterium]|nr:Fic family protein [Candidatus Dependentiae bacterium]